MYEALGAYKNRNLMRKNKMMCPAPWNNKNQTLKKIELTKWFIEKCLVKNVNYSCENKTTGISKRKRVSVAKSKTHWLF